MNSKTRGSGCKKLGSKIFLLRTRWVAIFALRVAALAYKRRSGSVRKSFATAFQA
ncbi:MAG: hypothetical protein MR878_02595 [Campylobacter sp.]|uniref:hypothetical protein n=1 Tax=Campylobacter sp. TaxID=205 RepID=UPI002AA83AA2|nr:hypothetical protein [Campylobacter sp.]MCI7014262.1 hypothetical protein [Campylobacter sp.]